MQLSTVVFEGYVYVAASLTAWKESESENITQLCLTLCDLMDCSPPDSSAHGILQARTLEWVAVPSARGSS